MCTGMCSNAGSWMDWKYKDVFAQKFIDYILVLARIGFDTAENEPLKVWR